MTVDPAVSARLIDQENRFGAHQDPLPDLVATRADGVYLWDVDGNRYMDFFAGGNAVNQGHNHTRIAAAMVEQCLRLSFSSGLVRNDRLPPFLEKLCTLTGFDQAVLACTGAEAVETAIQVARRWGYRHHGIAPGQAELLVFTGNGHGGSTTLLSAGDERRRSEDFAPFTAGFRLLPYGVLPAVQAALSARTCAILVEPVAGAAGVVVPPRGFLRGLRELCDAQGIPLLADETRCGLGRTGKFLACQHEGVKPDGVVLGRSLSGGFYPVSAFLATQDLMDGFTPDPLGSAFDGSPLACAVASLALDVLAEENLVDRAAELGAYFLQRLHTMDTRRIRAIRGIGLWAGIDLEPQAGGARHLCETLRQQGILCRESSEHTLVLAPPLVITREQLDWAVERLRVVLEA